MMSPIYTAQPVAKYLIYKVLLTIFVCFLWSSTLLRAQVLTCPDDYEVQLPMDECNVAIHYDSLVWSANFPASDPVFFPFPGTYLPTGITTITLAVSDNNNNLYTCDFEVNILAFNSTNFNCPGIVPVSLLGTCERELNATDILGNNFSPCDEDYTVEVFEGNMWTPAIISADEVGSTFNVRLTNQETGRSCESLVTVSGGETPAITCPSNIIQYCNEPTDPSYTGLPAIMGCYDTVTLSHFDVLNFTQCPDTFAFQITRTWHAVSPNGTQTTCEQLITGKRFPSNLVVFPEDFDGIANPVFSCNDTLSLTETAHPDVAGWPLAGEFPPDASVHCKFAVSYIDNVTHLCGDSYKIKRAWTVVNLCGPAVIRDTQTIIIADVNPPFFEIPDTLFFSNAGSCLDSVFLPASVVTAECSSFGVQISSAWGDFSTNGAWIHPDTVSGNYLVEYTLTDACGNDSTQTLILKVTDETLVSCPATDTVNCDYYLSVLSPGIQLGDYSVFDQNGLPSFYDNCSFDISQNATTDIDACGNGVITRNIIASNSADTLTCTQSIIVQHVSNFVVGFPMDTTICISPLLVNFSDPVITMINCEVISPSFTDAIIPSGLAGCFTINREWVIINSCAYAGDTTGVDEQLSTNVFRDNGDGFMSYTQVIHVNNNAAISFPNGCEIPDLYLGASDCTFDMNVPTVAVEGCGDNIAMAVSGSLGTTIGAPVSITPGSYSATYKATDECGKMKSCMTSFDVLDTIAPVALCKTDLVIEIFSQTGIVDVWANDFDNGSQDNCGNPLKFSFSPDPFDFNRQFTCDDLGLQLLTLWVTDKYDNQSHCQASLILQGPGCEPSLEIAGTVKTEQNVGVANVKVRILSPSGFDYTYTTANNGAYSISNVINGGDYSITPEKDTLPLNGVSTFDLVLIRKHILGVDTLDTPYKIIAADINNSGAVSTFDIVEIRKLILVINNSFPNNKSWRFVDAAYVFPNPLNPFTAPFPESIFVNDIVDDKLDANFVAIKIGDVNNSVITSLFTAGDGDGEEPDSD